MRRRWRSLARIALCAVVGVVQAAEIEVLHGGLASSEARALAELKQALATHGHHWKDFAVSGEKASAMALLNARVVAGNPPAAAQLNGPVIQEWAAEGALLSLEGPAHAANWEAQLPSAIAQALKYKAAYVALPLSVHRVNWLWVNPEVFRKAGVAVPRHWEEFPRAAEALQRAGFIALVLGGEPAQDFSLFESVVLGLGGAGFYKRALLDLEPAALNSPTMLKVLDTVAVLRKSLDKDRAKREGKLGTALLLQGSAAMLLAGDWVTAEFTAAGKKPGRDYLCLPAPGTDKAYLYRVDSLVMFRQANAEIEAAQAELASLAMTPELQQRLSLIDGGVPARQGLALEAFDDCARRSSADFASSAKGARLLPSIAHGMALPAPIASAMQAVLSEFFNGNSLSSRQAAERLLAASRGR